ncbi:hypothetical protein [Pseudonocardia acidicola]|uniref:Syndecan 1 n=1 Tax=Pseudonocardia acidicola TaxID=2724939 RepID=A0ABX1SP93_9PSEU|nr:hypothetical protein [Pseudonocardia acidicola]NMI02257.1 hypothetical protein [Pseudonocardia acidicola]
MLTTAAALRWSRPDLTAGIAEHLLAVAIDQGDRDLWSTAAGWAVHGRAAVGDARETAAGVLDDLTRWEGASSESVLGSESATRLRVELAGVAQDCGDAALARQLLEPWVQDPALPAELRLDGLAVLVRCALGDAPQQLDRLLGAADDTAGEVAGTVPGAHAALLRAAAERGRGRAALAVGRALDGLALLGWSSRSPEGRTPSEHLTAALASHWIGALLDDGRADEARTAAESVRSRLEKPMVASRQIGQLRLTVARAMSSPEQSVDTVAALSRAAEDASASDTPGLEAACRAALAELHEATGQLDAALVAMRLGVTAERLDRERSARFRSFAERLTAAAVSAPAAPRGHATAPTERRSTARRALPDSSAARKAGAADPGGSAEDGTWVADWLAEATARAEARTADERGGSTPRRASRWLDEPTEAQRGSRGSAEETGTEARRALRALDESPDAGARDVSRTPAELSESEVQVASPAPDEPADAGARAASNASGESTAAGRRAARSQDPEPTAVGTWTAWEAAGSASRATRGSLPSTTADSTSGNGRGTAEEAPASPDGRGGSRSSTRRSRRSAHDGPPPSPGFVLSGSPLGDALASKFRNDGAWSAESWKGEFRPESPATAQAGAGVPDGSRHADAWPADVWASGSPANSQAADGRHDAPSAVTTQMDRSEILAAGRGSRRANGTQGGSGSTAERRDDTARPAEPHTSRPAADPEPTVDAAQAAGDWLSAAIAELDRVWGAPPPDPAAPRSATDGSRANRRSGPESRRSEPEPAQAQANPSAGTVVVLDLAAGDQRITGTAPRSAMRRVSRRLGGDLPEGARLRNNGPDVVEVTLPGMERGAAAAWLHRVLGGLAEGLPTGPELDRARLRATVQGADGTVGAQILHELGPSSTPQPPTEAASRAHDPEPADAPDEDTSAVADGSSASSRHAADGRRPFRPDGIEVRPGSGGRRHRRGPHGDTPPPAPAESTVEDPAAGLGLADLLAGALAAYRGI